MKLFSKDPQLQQTEFAATQTWLEEPTTTPQEQAERAERKKKQKKALFILIGITLIGFVCISLLLKVMSRPPAEVIVVAEPTPVPTEAPVLTPLLSRILESKARTQAIDIRDADLSLPQVEFDLWLDEPKKP